MLLARFMKSDYYPLKVTNARSGPHTPRSCLQAQTQLTCTARLHARARASTLAEAEAAPRRRGGRRRRRSACGSTCGSGATPCSNTCTRPSSPSTHRAPSGSSPESRSVWACSGTRRSCTSRGACSNCQAASRSAWARSGTCRRSTGPPARGTRRAASGSAWACSGTRPCGTSRASCGTCPAASRSPCNRSGTLQRSNCLVTSCWQGEAVSGARGTPITSIWRLLREGTQPQSKQ
jgi:hypothetical protein